MGDRNDIDASWLTFDGKVINPGAPAGGGGAGNFRIAAGPVGVDNPVFPALPSPDSPAGLYDDPAIPLDDDGNKPEQKINPPPVTATGEITKLEKQDDIYDVLVTVTVLNDTVDANSGTAGDTHFEIGPSPNFGGYDQVDGKITGFKSKFTYRGDITVQVTYIADDEKTKKSAYGRGTTKKDIKEGNVTVGFHESCHVADFRSWLELHPLPMPKLSIGMTPQQYEAEQSKFTQKWTVLRDGLEPFSVKNTDEVGTPTKSQFEAMK